MVSDFQEVVDQFLGMGYAHAPLGELRFIAPREPEYDCQEKDASQVGHVLKNVVTSNVEAWIKHTSFIIVRRRLTGYRTASWQWSRRYCRFVDVFKTSDAAPDSKLPVSIYIQGGVYAAIGNPNYNLRHGAHSIFWWQHGGSHVQLPCWCSWVPLQ